MREEAEVAQGFDDPESDKRRGSLFTGRCRCRMGASRMLRRALPGMFLLTAATGLTPFMASRASTLPAAATATVTAGCTDPGTWVLSQRLEQLLMVSGQFSDLGASTSMAAAGVGGFVFFGQPAAGSGSAIRFGMG